MPQIICFHKGAYNIYSTITDRFLFNKGVGIGHLKTYYKKKYGSEALKHLPDRLSRARTKGVSSPLRTSLRGTIVFNKEGENESPMPTEECLEKFFKT